MPAGMVRVVRVVDLETKLVLQEVARLLSFQAGDGGGPIADTGDLERAGLGQHAGHLTKVIWGGDAMGAGATLELAQRADVRRSDVAA